LGSGLAESRELTAAAWINPASSKSMRILEKPGNEFIFDILAGKLRLISTAGTFGGTAAVPAGRWSHVAVTIAPGTLRLFLNGEPCGEARSGRPLTLSAGPLLIGTTPDGRYSFNGSLADLRLYNRALTPAEISTLHAGGR